MLENDYYSRSLSKLRLKTAQIVKLQALVRGFIWRCKFARAIKRKTDEDFCRGRLRILDEETNHPNVNSISQKLGPYDYEKNTPYARLAFCSSSFIDAKLVKRAAVQVSDGIFYEGEWIKDAREPIRMGRGVQLWPDGSRYEGFWREG